MISPSSVTLCFYCTNMETFQKIYIKSVDKITNIFFPNDMIFIPNHTALSDFTSKIEINFG